MASKIGHKIFPKYLLKFLLKMGILMLIFTLCRILFLAFNIHHFPNYRFLDFFAGMWFDLITTILLFYPLVLIELFPNKNRKRKWFVWTTRILTALPFFLGTLINLIDVEYFHHTSSRSGSGLITMLGFGNDLGQQIPSFLTDYWYLFLFLFLFLFVAYYLLKKVYVKRDDSSESKIGKQSLIYVIMIALFLILGRGGIGYKPISTADAAKFTTPENMQLVLNSAFKVINSYGANELEPKEYFSEDELSKIYHPIHHYDSDGRIKGQNVVVIILESFSTEFIDVLNEDDTKYTPFFDDLAAESMLFTNCFANGKKSMDAVPAVAASIPKLMEREYVTSYYNGNQITSLPSLLEEKGYKSAFFHGATNGSMNFDSFCELAEYQEYFGRTEYDNEDHFDGTWGIFDEEFMSWSIDRFSEMKEPFFNTLFTISSHAPYAIPERYQDRFKGGPSRMHDAVGYADYALEQFFEKAKTQSWYDNTLFVITADHTPASNQAIYLSDYGLVNIPLLLYHPTDTFFSGTNDRIVGQIDIMPTILDLTGYDKKFFSFGNSIFGSEEAMTVYEVAGKQVIFGTFEGKKYSLAMQDEQLISLYELDDHLQKNNLLETHPKIAKGMERKLKAFVQTYNDRLLNNSMNSSE
ncbi:MAG: phosphoglycerol transferase MdoB-like AlkP superfamily enzyme [Arenicella sp.]|jgi:phosphoglycerol transferase MdoB-like AlkP superfamily enzyme